MNSKDLKLSISQIIEQINDTTVLEAYYEILKNLLKVQRSQIVGYDIDGQAISSKATNEDLKKDFKNW